MRPLSLLAALLLSCCAALSGCRSTGELENQAYVLVLGVDRLQDGQIGLTARIPKIGKGDDQQKQQAGGDSPYLTFTASSDGWTRALDALEQATPRRLNLSHIQLMVISKEVAREEGFAALAMGIARTRHLYTTARFVVCEGSARAFVEAGKTVIGKRMSAELRAMLNHYASLGYIPDSSFADACYALGSYYSDPVAIYGRTDEPTGDTSMAQRFSGAALFSRGRFVAVLDAERTRLLSLIRGELKTLQFKFGGDAWELNRRSRPLRRVRIESGAPVLTLSLEVYAPEIDDEASRRRVGDALSGAVEALIADCQRLGCDPFGFSEAAAAGFLTERDWQAFGWRERYTAAEVRVKVRVLGAA